MHDIVTNMLISDTQNWTKTRYLRLHFMGKTIWWVMGWAKTFRFFPIFLYGYVVLPVNVAAGHTIGPVQAHGFRLTALLVLIEQWISHSLITSSALEIWHSTFHTPVVEEVTGPRDICQAELTARFPSGVSQQVFECLPQSLADNAY